MQELLEPGRVLTSFDLPGLPASPVEITSREQALHWWRNHCGELVELQDQAADADPASPTGWRTALWAQGVLHHTNECELWLRLAETGRRTARHAGNSLAEALVLASRYTPLARTQQHAAALADTERAQTLADTTDLTIQSYLHAQHGRALTDAGRATYALPVLHTARELAHRSQDTLTVAFRNQYLAEAHLALGHTTDATDTYISALHGFETTGAHAWATPCRAQLAELRPHTP